MNDVITHACQCRDKKSEINIDSNLLLQSSVVHRQQAGQIPIF